MSRDNRKENRTKAKEAANANANEGDGANAGASASTGFELDDLLKIDEVDEEEIDTLAGSEEENDEEENENALKSEADKTAANAKSVKSESAEEEGAKAKAEASGTSDPDGSGNKVGETAEEIAAAAKKKEEEDKAKAVAKPEPTAEELAAAEAAKAAKAKADAEAKAPKTLTDEEAAKLFTEWRGETETLLAQHHYKLTEEDVTALNDNPAEFIPRAMSRVYLDSISAAFQQFVQYLPRMVNQVLEQRAANITQEDQFFAAWPQLKAHERGRDTVLRLGAAYRSSNPSASMEDFVNEVGAQSMVALRLNPEVKTNGNANASEKAFKPASPGGTPPPPPPKKPANPFEQLAQEFGNELDEEEVDDS